MATRESYNYGYIYRARSKKLRDWLRDDSVTSEMKDVLRNSSLDRDEEYTAEELNFTYQIERNSRTSYTSTTYYCSASSCYSTVSSSGDYCSYHQREREREENERREREARLEQERRNEERRKKLEYERRIQEEQLHREERREREREVQREQERVSAEQRRREAELRIAMERVNIEEKQLRREFEEKRMTEERIRIEREVRQEDKRNRAEERKLMEERQRRENECQYNSCRTQKLTSQAYCLVHINKCSENSCSARISSNQSYCSSHQTHSCSSCYVQIPRYQTYCYSHLASCQTCTKRIVAGRVYCDIHAFHKCQESSCRSQINVSQPYCSSHVSSCAEPNCLARVSYIQRYCLSHKKQTSQKWREEGKITEEERKKLNELNLNGEYALKQLKEILEEDAYVNDSPIISEIITKNAEFQTIIRDNLSSSLKRVRPKLAQAAGGGGEPPTEIIPFSTWFNADCATIVSKLNWIKLFDVWVAVRENPIRKIEGFVDIIWISEHSGRNEAREKAAIVREKMNGESPALYIAPSLQVFYNNSDYLFVNIIKADLPIDGDIIEDPSEYLLPLDIVERSSGGSIGSGGSYRHAAIYLGQDPKEPDKKRKHKVCHVFAPGPSRSQAASIGSSAASGTTVGSSASGPSGGSSSGGATLSSASFSEKKKAKARIDNWETFLTDNPKELVRYRITIPFKKYEKEIEQITKAVVTEFGKGNYHLVDRNCEHFAFNISCGVNFSEQEQVNRDKWYRKFLYRRGSKIEKMDLEREINKSDEVFDNLVSGSMEEETISDKEVVKKFEEIEKWSRDRSLFETPQEAKIEVRVIVPPKYHNWK